MSSRRRLRRQLLLSGMAMVSWFLSGVRYDKYVHCASFMPTLLPLKFSHLFHQRSLPVVGTACWRKGSVLDLYHRDFTKVSCALNEHETMSIPVFPLRKRVRFPTDQLTFNLYEERYLQMAEYILGEQSSTSHQRSPLPVLGIVYGSHKPQMVRKGTGPIFPMVSVGDFGVLCIVQNSEEAYVPTIGGTEQRRRIRLEVQGIVRFRIEQIVQHGYETTDGATASSDLATTTIDHADATGKTVAATSTVDTAPVPRTNYPFILVNASIVTDDPQWTLSSTTGTLSDVWDVLQEASVRISCTSRKNRIPMPVSIQDCQTLARLIVASQWVRHKPGGDYSDSTWIELLEIELYSFALLSSILANAVGSTASQQLHSLVECNLVQRVEHIESMTRKHLSSWRR